MKAHRRFIWSSEVYAEREISKNLSEFPAPFSYNEFGLGVSASLHELSILTLNYLVALRQTRVIG